MWTALFPKWKNFRVYFFSKEAKATLDRLLHEPFLLKCEKISKKHRNFLLTFVSSTEPDLFLKLFLPHPFKRNRVKSYLKNLLELKKRDVPLLEPFFLFWKNHWLASLLDELFYGGIAFPYLKEGFLTFESAKMLLISLIKFLFSLHEKGVYLRDTKFNNFYYTNKTGFKVFDLDGVKLYSNPLPKKMRLKELATLAMTLEWEGLTHAGELIWNEYAKLYPAFTEKDFIFFEKIITLRRKKRENHLAKN